MNPVLKCDAERRALLMDYDLPKIMMTDANELARTNSGNYGSIVVDHWYLREVPNKPQDSSDSSSTCCSSSSEEDATSINRSNEVTVMLSDHDDSTQEDKQHKHHATSKVGNILTYQNSSLTASTCSNTSYSEYDSDDVEMGERDVSEFTTVCFPGPYIDMRLW